MNQEKRQLVKRPCRDYLNVSYRHTPPRRLEPSRLIAVIELRGRLVVGWLLVLVVRHQ